MNKEEIKKDFLKEYGYSTLFEFVDTCDDFELYINILEDYFEKQSRLDTANEIIANDVLREQKLRKQLSIANKKLDEIKKHCNLSTTYEFNEIKNNHNSFDHQRIINNNNKILSIIGGSDE